MEIVVIAIVLVMLLVSIEIFATHKYSQQPDTLKKNVATKPLRSGPKDGRKRVGTYS